MPGKIKNIINILKRRRPINPNPKVIDGKDVTQTRFKGVNRKGENVVKTGISGKEYESYIGANVKLKKKLQNKIWKEDLYKNMYQKLGSKNKKFGGAIGPNGIL
tara:strand:- start:70 stop:381 length:312 start_codon:yes stop_codon:yes gene_type:complete